MKKYLIKSLKIIAWILVGILGIFLLLVLLLQIPAFQKFTKNKVIGYVENKIGTKVSIGEVEIGLPKNIILSEVYIEDQAKDTLLYGKKLFVNLNLIDLIDSNVIINSVKLDGIVANISKNKEGIFNFDYIIDAFVSKTPTTPKSKSIFSIEDVNLDNVKFNYKDAVSKNNLNFNLRHLDTKITTFDLDNMKFKVPKITIDGLNLKLNQGIAEALDKVKQEGEKQIEENFLQLDLGTADLNNFNIIYGSESSRFGSKIKFEKLLVDFNVIDLQKQKIDIKKIQFLKSDGDITFGKSEKIAIAQNNVENSTVGNWEVKLNQIDFKQINFKFDDDNELKINRGIDYSHLELKDLNLDAETVSYTVNATSGKINSFSAKEKSGLQVDELSTTFLYSEKQSYLKNLLLKTPKTEIKDEVIVFYNSIKDLQNNPEKSVIDAKIKNSKLAFSDLLLVAPQLNDVDAFRNYPNAVVNINAIVLGKLSQLAIKDFQLDGLGKTSANFKGSISGLPNYETATYNLAIKKLTTSKRDILLLAPKNSLPTNIDFPNSVSVNGTFNGTISNFLTNLNVSSDFGSAKIVADYDQRITNNEKYKAKLDLVNFNVGRLLKNNQFGQVTGKFDIKGQSFDPKKANATIDAAVYKMYYNKYTYTGLDVNGTIKNGLFDAEAHSTDSNLKFDLVSSGGFNDKYPSAKVNLKLDIADLNKLNLHAGPLKMRGDFVADFETVDLDYLNGTFSGTKLLVATEKEQFPLDSISVKASSTSEKNTIVLKSQFASATVDGKFKLSKIGDALINSISRYYKIGTSQKFKEEQNLTFKIAIKDDPILYKLLPQMQTLSDINISGKYNSVNDTIVINGTIPKLIYEDIAITDAVLKVDTKENKLDYSLIVNDIKTGQFQLPYTEIIGKIEENIVDYVVRLRDLKNKDRYIIGGTLENDNSNSVVKLDPTNLVLNYDKWKLPEANEIQIGANGIYANAFELSKGSDKIAIQSESKAKNAPLNIELSNFDLKTLSSIAQSDYNVSGITNGKVQLKNLYATVVFTSDLKVENFMINKDTIGNLSIKVDNKIANVYNANVEITGNGNQVNIDGNYKTGTSSLDLIADIKQLNMQSIQGFTMGNLKKSVGYIKGRLKINGTTSSPTVNGNIKFVESGFTVTPLNAAFKLINDEILFTGQTIDFNDFKFRDENDNKLIINGKINSQDYTNLGFDLNLKSNNFKAVNSKAKDNPLYYGELFLDNDLNVRGTYDNPVIDGNVKINKDTKFTVVLPQSDPSIASRDGIVEFVDRDQPKLIDVSPSFKDMNQSLITGIDASVNIEVDKEAEISIVIDKANGDFIKLVGEARLTGGIDPSGKTSLTGRYEFTSGQYEMNFNLIKRKFDIKPGSYILWTGEPTSANVNITAIYKSETAPIDLLNDQLGSLSVQERNTYKQKIPFETELKMTGDLLTPEISFDIVLPEGNNDVSATVINTTKTKLEQLRTEPQELNKQVFALLLLNRFIGENPFKTEAEGITASGLARQSASRILSEQLNNIAGDLISGFELDFNLESSEDYTSGEKNTKTDLNVGLSKKLLNDRLKITIGSNIGLEGAARQNEQVSNFAGDLSADYLLTKDGRYKVRAYRKNRYQVALEGQVIETGVGFIITMDYNKFSELFKNKKNAKKN